MKYYYIINPNSKKGFDKLTETEFQTIIGTGEVRQYANQVYCGELSISEVPFELQDSVQSVVNAKIAKFGEYGKQKISAKELKTMIEGAI